MANTAPIVRIWLYPWVLMILFGPRVYGIDFSFISAIAGLLLAYRWWPQDVLKVCFENYYSRMVIFAALYIVIVGLTYLYVETTSLVSLDSRFYYFFRLVRSLAVWVVLATLCINNQGILAARTFFMMGMIHVLSIYVSVYDIFGGRDFVIELNTFNKWGEEGWEVYKGTRAKGLMTGYDQAGLFVLGWFLVGWIIFKKIIAKTLLIVVAFIAMIYTSRTALYLYIIIAILYVIHKAKKVSLLWLSCGVVLLAFATAIAISYSQDLALHLAQNETLAKSFELIINILLDNNFHTSSSDDTLSNHYVYQAENWIEYIFGNPERSSSDGKLDSDVAYLQIIYNFGIFVGSFLIIYHYRLLFKALLAKKTMILKFFIVISLALLLAAFKGPYLFGRGYYDLWLIFFALTYYSPTFGKTAVNDNKARES